MNDMTAPNVTPPACDASFRWITSQYISSLNLEVQQFEHIGTGAAHYHLASDSPENVFLVGLRTVPTDSCGVAHILEHTVLCGSEKYPVRDPFFMMLRRSLNTFMNAFTSSDWTAFPFASQNRKDYFNLLDVYLDAVFFSRLDPLDFAQEGHRVEFAEQDDPTSELVYKGVVFNEMKGAMSSPVSVLWQTMSRYLYPQSTYHFNSGGEPGDIPDLSYDELISFYRTHYHPGNAIFMTYGDLPAQELQQRFNEQALARFGKLDRSIDVADEKRYFAPVRVSEYYVSDDKAEEHTHHTLGWLLGPSINLYEQLEAHLLSNVLLQDSASPLRYALETSELGAAPSPLCGLEDSNREMCFMCGLEGSAPEHAEAVEALVLETLQKVAEDGIGQAQLDAVLHQLELSQREVRGDGMPYGLQLILSGLPSAVHRGDPIAMLNLDPVLERLRKAVADPEYIKGLVKRLLLDNPHRVRLSLVPDTELANRKQQAEAARLMRIKESLSEQDCAQIVELSQQLEQRQQQQDDETVLPKVGIEDIPDSLSIPEGHVVTTPLAMPVTYFNEGTNGLLYQEVIAELPQLEPELLDVLPYYCTCLTELGCGDSSYLEMQAKQSAVSGGISAFRQIRGAVDDEQVVKGHLTVVSKALSRNQLAMSELVHETFTGIRFDELERIKELVSQIRARSEQSVTGRGHALAMSAAASKMSPTAALAHRLSGLAGITGVKELDARLQDSPEALQHFASQMERIHTKVLAAPRQFLLVGEADMQEESSQTLAAQWGDSLASGDGFTGLSLDPVRDKVAQVWTTNTQVNFCAKAYPTVAKGHTDSAPLTVLGEYLKNGYLHRVIREQGGAYGSYAGQDGESASFRFSSYRDPRLQDTLDDFDRAVQWLLNETHEARQLEEAILGIIGSLDKPGSPAGEAKRTFHGNLHGRTPEQRERFRQQILQVTQGDLLHVAEKYLVESAASIAVVTSVEQVEKLTAPEVYEHFKL